MTLTGPQKIPFAVHSGASWYQDTYLGDAMEVNVGVLHTTEGPTLSDYDGGAVAPNVTGVPDRQTQTIKWYQHFDVDRSSRALVNAAGGVQTNTLNCFQIELVGTCDQATYLKWQREGVWAIYWPGAPDWALAEVAKLVKWLHDNHGMRIESSVTWKAYPDSYGANNGVRLTGSQWLNYYGWLGHQHVPENYHGDPGNINWKKIEDYAKGVAPGGDTNVALTADDLAKIKEAVWSTDDAVPAARPPVNNADYYEADGTTLKNTGWTGGYSLQTAVEGIRKTQQAVGALTAKVDALSVSGVDLDALAAKVADLLAARLQS